MTKYQFTDEQITSVQLSEVLQNLQRQETFENDTTIFFTYEVDPDYKTVVEQMAVGIYQHDKGSDAIFPTGDNAEDSPYLCKADDALRAAIPLLRNKFANDIAVFLELIDDPVD